MKKNILITGATGFVGRNIVSILGNNYNFINLGRNETKLCENIVWNPQNKFVCNKKIDTVIHCASIVGNNEKTIGEYIDANVKFTSDLLDFCSENKVKNFIYVSTGGVYGFKEEKSNESDLCEPKGIYNLTKKFSEDLCLMKQNEMKVAILRLFFPYGPNQEGRLFDSLIKSILDNNMVNLNIDGYPKINPIHINDFVEIVKLIIEKDVEGVFNVSGDEEVTIRDIADIIVTKLKKSNVKYLYNNQVISNMIGDNKKLVCELGYTNKKSIAGSMDEIIENYII